MPMAKATPTLATSTIPVHGFSLGLEPVTTPLTTVFTPPASCYNGPWSSISSKLGLITCGQVEEAISACVPHYSGEALTYSPGVCPHGYYVAQIQSGTAFLPPWPGASDYGWNSTTSFCCPPYMTFLQAGGSCATLITTPGPVVFGEKTSYYTSSFVAAVFAITVVWATSDLKLFTPRSAPLLDATNAPSTQSPNTTTQSSTLSSSSSHTTRSSDLTSPTPLAQSSLPPKAKSLSSGARAGIGVGVAVGVIVIVGIVYAIWQWRRHRLNSKRSSSEQYLKPELPGEEAARKFPELGADGERAEMGGQGVPAEVEGHQIHEMEGNWCGNEIATSHPVKK